MAEKNPYLSDFSILEYKPSPNVQSPPQTWCEQVYRKTMAKKSLLELSVFLIKNFNFLMRWAGKNSP